MMKSSSSSGGGRRSEGVKIVQIETRYVQTDAMNFRDVVQSLTGKNSSTAWVGNNNIDINNSNIINNNASYYGGDVRVKPEEEGANSNNNNNSNASDLLSSVILKNVSFHKDFERVLLSDLPMDDLPWLLGR
ncbi:VQ motif-containing protein 1-like [Senna tora]|uniref:VQ motif-containing protein 1-like n=1 Tax=Senna tora TaxID=362788 RepID=A0A834W3N0_9FABA|nr:VQ motif-containing protein 1-like [Senna tora]